MPSVAAVARSDAHRFSKPLRSAIRLLAGLGVEDDTHAGTTVQHRSRVAADPTQPNLRQVHLIHTELFDDLRVKGFSVAPGDLGENIATTGLDLLALPRHARLHIGATAIVEVTGLRNPCVQIDRFRPGLMQAVLGRDADGGLVLKAGIMAIVIAGGDVRPGDPIAVHLPPSPHQRLERV